jgi:hypothetical protein
MPDVAEADVDVAGPSLFDADDLSMRVARVLVALREHDAREPLDWDGRTLAVTLFALGASILKGAGLQSDDALEIVGVLYRMAEMPRKGD